MQIVQVVEDLLKRVPGATVLVNTHVIRAFRHSLNLRFADRKTMTFTRFLRIPTQFEALSGPVLDFLWSDQSDTTLSIAILGCSNGAEVYSVASILRRSRPDVKFRISAVDLNREMIGRARSAIYAAEEIFANDMITPEFVDATFDRENGMYRVKGDLRERTSFIVGDVMDPKLKEVIGTQDIVYAQNVLVHMKPKVARKTFEKVYELLKSRAALFVEGIDLGLRYELTLAHGLHQLSYKIEDIYNEARAQKGA